MSVESETNRSPSDTPANTRSARRALPLTPALIAASALGVLLNGCGGIGARIDRYLPDQRLEYKQQREALENLELPPDLMAASFDDALDIPPASGVTTFSEYIGTRERRQRISGGGQVLPTVAGVELERSGDTRWLRIDQPPQQVWPQVVAFWRQQGILLVEQEPAIGVMRTDWIENRAEIRRDFVTRMFRKVADGLYSTATRDQFRVRIDAGSRPGTTELHLSHRAMEERMVRNTLGEDFRTVWEPAPNDPGKEAAMLRRLMLSLGISDQEAQRMLAQPGGRAPAARATRVVQSGGGSLLLSAPFPEAWRRIGLALDRSGFAVEDRNRSEGVFFVRYGDPNTTQTERRGMISRLAFWNRGDRTPSVEQYQVRLSEEQDQTRVTIRDASGAPDNSATAERILSLLNEELR